MWGSGVSSFRNIFSPTWYRNLTNIAFFVPKSPVARLDTVETRLNAMTGAIKSVRPDFQNFYASLNDEQKAKFNTIGPPPKATSSPSQRQSGGQQ